MRLEDALAYAWRMLDHWKLTQLGWSISTDERSRVLGHCCHGYKVITLSVLHVDQHSDADVCNTVLHEIAHALCGPSGPREDCHGERWQAYARIVGATPEACARCSAPTRRSRRTSQSDVIYL